MGKRIWATGAGSFLARCLATFALFTCCGLWQTATAAVPAQYEDALYDAGYDVYSGDLNADGYPDLLLKAKHQFVLIDYEVLIPVLLRWRNSFVVLSNPDGTYSIQLSPSAATLSNPIWQAGTHELIFGDSDGDGSLEMLIRAKTVNGVSVLMTTSATDGVPQLRQRLNAIDIGIDLGQSGLDVDLVQVNNDGRADLLTSRGGVVETIHMATTGGTFGEPEDDGGSGSSGAVVVGSTAGAFQATPGGASSYRIPLSLPPGLGGMTPQLAIEYSSSGPDATMGLGFGVSGLSQIARCPSTIAVDDSSDGIDFDEWDRFCLDGQRLLTTDAGGYGAVGAAYVTEIESFSRIKSAGGTLGNPASWTVETKSGLKMTYGGTGGIWSGTAGTYVWLLTKTQDSVGNSIDYEYYVTASSYRIKQITYGGNASAGMPADLRVTFNYQGRQGYTAGGYMYGALFTRDYILGSVEASINNGGQIVRSWNFIYNSPAYADDPEPPGTEPPPCPSQHCAIPRPARVPAKPGALVTVGSKTMSMSRYALTSVQECAGRKSVAGTACLPTSSFVWAPAIGSGYGSVINSSAGTYSNDKFQYVPADINGDGYGDLAILRAAGGTSTFSVFPKGGLDSSARIDSPTISQLPTGDAKWAMGDFNGDGMADAALFYDEINCGNPLYFRPGSTASTVGALMGGGLDTPAGGTCSADDDDGPPVGCPPNCQRPVATATATPMVTQMVAGDINGDGQDDILLISNTASGFKWRKVYTTGTGWQPNSSWDTAAAGDQTGYVPYAADFNGDGKIDIMLLKAASDGVYAWTCVDLGPCTNAGKILTYNVTQYAPIIGDTNGDGYADLVFVKTSGSTAYHYALLSTGRSTFSAVVTSGGLSLTASGSWRPAAGDYDGDGVIDIAWFDQSSPHDVIMAAGNGNGSFMSSETLSPAFTNVPSTFYLNPADYDGDGKVDLGVFSKDSSNNATIRMARFTGASNLRVAAITGGFGAKVGIEYQPLTSADVYADDPEATTEPGVVRRLNVPQYVVARHTTEAQDQPTRSVAYRYYGSRLHIGGRGPLGFSRTEIQDEQTGILEATTYRQDFPYIGLAKHVERKIASSGTLISSADNVYSAIEVSQKASFPYASKSTARQYEINDGIGLVTTTVSTSNYSYSDYATYGNLRSSKVTVYQGDEGAATRFETATTNTFQNYTSSGWYIGRLMRTDVTRTNDKGESKSRTSSFAYDPTTGLLSDEIVEPDRVGTYDYLKTAYGRNDGVGNITSTAVSAYVPNSSGTPVLKSRTSTNQFSAAAPYYRRFNTQSCNALNQCATREFDAATGNVLKSADANNLVSTLSYDSFGRAAGSSFIQSDKYIVSDVVRQWCADRDDQCFGETKGLFALETQASTGTRSVVVYDRLEREIRRATLGPDGRWLYALTQYDALGRVSRVSVPRYDNSSQTFWVKTQYDAIGRPYQVTSPAKAGDANGRVVTTAYQGLTTVVTDPRNADTTQVLNALGKVVSVKNHLDQELQYEYDPYDNLTKTTDPAGNTVVLHYDQRGRKDTMSDPDMGSWSYAYNGFGELNSQTDAKNQVVTMTYDNLGRMVKREELEGKTVWTYDTRWKGALSDAVQTSPTNTELSRKTLEYDAVGNLKQETLTVAGSVQAPTQYAYDSKNRLEVLTYPSGLILQHRYNANGALSELRKSSASGPLYWRADSWDEWGKVAQYTLGNGVVSAVYRDPAVGQVEMLQAGSGNSIQDWHYDWDTNGNTTLRENLISGLTYSEDSTYDKLNRVNVTTLTIQGTSTTKNANYDALGNLQFQNGVGTYTYDPANKPHAVRGTTSGARAYDYDANGNMAYGDGSAGRRDYHWTSYNLPDQVTQGSAWSTFVYGPSREKLRQTSYSSDLSNRTIVYLNAYSERHTTDSGDEYREHIVAPTGVVAQVSYYPSTASRTTLYVHTDKLGSVDAMSNTAGQNLALTTSAPGFGYDRWGKRRDDSAAASPSSLNFATLKGYAGHEMLDTVGLIHMGGRVYDPTIGRFLSPDPYIQDPNNLQSYNRYSYVMNNPLSATDPTGFFSLGSIFHSIGKAFDWAKDNWRTLAAVAITVVSAGTGSFVWVAVGGFAAGYVGSGGSLQAGLIGAVTAMAFYGVGSGFGWASQQSWAAGNQFALSIAKVAAHGVVGGVSTQLSGGKFKSGFYSGSFTEAFGVRTGNYATDIAAAAIVGGTASDIGGGKFANGAITGAFSYAFNHAQHDDNSASQSHFRRYLSSLWAAPTTIFNSFVAGVNNFARWVGQNSLSVAGGGCFYQCAAVEFEESFEGGKPSVMVKGGWGFDSGLSAGVERTLLGSSLQPSSGTLSAFNFAEATVGPLSVSFESNSFTLNGSAVTSWNLDVGVGTPGLGAMVGTGIKRTGG